MWSWSGVEGEPATASSDPDGTVPSSTNPLVATASGPAGPITLAENAGSPVAGYAGLGHGAEIHAPDAPADDPLVLTFDVHVPDDVPAGAVLVARNGVVVTKTCTAPGVAAPDPCEASRSRTGDTLRITVHSTRASQWDLVVPSVLRIAGADRIATSVAVSAATWGAGRAGSVVLSRADAFPDALAASAAAGHVGGVVVLTEGGRLPEATRAYLATRGSTPVYAVGGPAAAALAGVVPDAVTLAGPDRYATSALVADRFFDAGAVVGIATGQSFPDALAAGARLGRSGAPLLLTPPGGLTPPVAALVAQASRAELYGGDAVLSESFRNQVAGLVA